MSDLNSPNRRPGRIIESPLFLKQLNSPVGSDNEPDKSSKPLGFGRYHSIIVKGTNKITNMPVAIKIYGKKKMNQSRIH